MYRDCNIVSFSPRATLTLCPIDARNSALRFSGGASRTSSTARCESTQRARSFSGAIGKQGFELSDATASSSRIPTISLIVAKYTPHHTGRVRSTAVHATCSDQATQLSLTGPRANEQHQGTQHRQGCTGRRPRARTPRSPGHRRLAGWHYHY
jgi:hypothetical protein